MGKQNDEVQLYAVEILALDGEDPAWSTSLARGGLTAPAPLE